MLALGLALFCFFKVILTLRRDYSSLLMDEDIYATTFWRSDQAGRFELNSWSISTLLGYYFLWKVWAIGFGKSLFAMRLLSTTLCVSGVIAGFVVLRHTGFSRRDSWIWSLVILGTPALFLSQYFMSDAPVFAATVVFWALVLAVPRCRYPILAASSAFVVIGYACTVRQTAVFSALGGCVWLILPRVALAARIRCCCLVWLCLCLLSTAVCKHHVDQEPYNTNDAKLAGFSESGFVLANCKSYTPGKTLNFSNQALVSLFTIAAVPLTLFGFASFVSHFRNLGASRFGIMVLGWAVLTIFLTTVSYCRRFGVLGSALSPAVVALTGWDYGGPSSEVGRMTAAVLLICCLGWGFLLLKCAGFATLVGAVANCTRDDRFRNERVLACLATLPAIATIGACLWHGLVICPRYLISSLPALLLLWRAVLVRGVTGLSMRAVSWYAFASVAVLGVCNVLQFYDSLRFSEASWSAREQYQKTRQGFPEVLTSSHNGFAAHGTTRDLALRFPESSPKLWFQGQDYTLKLERLDPLKGSANNVGEILVPLTVYMPPKSVAYKAIGVRSNEAPK
jgi:hypothetical protein